jgi:hypothetical protein
MDFQIFKREISVINPSEQIITDVQIALDSSVISGIKADMPKVDFSSIRLFNNSQFLNFWIPDTQLYINSRLWLRLDTLRPGTNDLVLMYSQDSGGDVLCFDSVFNKFAGDSGSSIVFHLDEGCNQYALSSSGRDTVYLDGAKWSEKDGGAWGRIQDIGFASGSAAIFPKNSSGFLQLPQEVLNDSFTIALWLCLDTLDNLSFSEQQRTIIESPGNFSLRLKRGTFLFTTESIKAERSISVPPMGWERVGVPHITEEYIPQGITAYGNELLLSAYSKSPAKSRVWSIDPYTLEIKGWFDMPWDATHTSGLSYDSAARVLWACDYDAGKVYKIDVEKSLVNKRASVLGQFLMQVPGVSACCIVPIEGTLRLLVSSYKDKYTYLVDHELSLERGSAVIIGKYRNVPYSQGLAYDGKYVWESGGKLAQYKLDIALETGDYLAGLVRHYSELVYPEDITFFKDTLYMPHEYSDKGLYRLTGDPREGLGTWYHLAITCGGGYLRFFLNGEVRDSTRVYTKSESGPDIPVFLGGSEMGKSSIEGMIDEVVFSSRPYSKEEVSALFERRNYMATPLKIELNNKEDTLSDIQATERISKLLGIKTSSSSIILVVPYQKLISVLLYDVTGRKLTTLFQPQYYKGSLVLDFPSWLSEGVYFLNVQYGDQSFNKKVVLFK